MKEAIYGRMSLDYLKGLKKFEGDLRLKLEIEDLAANWKELYPRLDIRKQLVLANAWCLANPKKAPRYQNARFLNSWMRLAEEFAVKSPYVKPIEHLPPDPGATQNELDEMHRQTVKALGPQMCKEEHCKVCGK